MNTIKEIGIKETILNKYILNSFFHDCLILKILYSASKNIFSIKIQKNTTKYLLTCSCIFKFEVVIDFLVEKENYKFLDWSKIFLFSKDKTIDNISVEESEYFDVSKEFLKNTAKKIVVKTNCGYNYYIDCSQLDILRL